MFCMLNSVWELYVYIHIQGDHFFPISFLKSLAVTWEHFCCLTPMHCLSAFSHMCKKPPAVCIEMLLSCPGRMISALYCLDPLPMSLIKKLLTPWTSSKHTQWAIRFMPCFGMCCCWDGMYALQIYVKPVPWDSFLMKRLSTGKREAFALAL